MKRILLIAIISIILMGCAPKEVSIEPPAPAKEVEVPKSAVGPLIPAKDVEAPQDVVESPAPVKEEVVNESGGLALSEEDAENLAWDFMEGIESYVAAETYDLFPVRSMKGDCEGCYDFVFQYKLLKEPKGYEVQIDIKDGIASLSGEIKEFEVEMV